MSNLSTLFTPNQHINHCVDLAIGMGLSVMNAITDAAQVQSRGYKLVVAVVK
jgi:hypothetical protein